MIRELKVLADGRCTLSWQDRRGRTQTIDVPGVSFSDSAVCVECPDDVEFDGAVFIRAQNCRNIGTGVIPADGPAAGESAGNGASNGHGASAGPGAAPPHDDTVDYYEILQISPNAELETIRRVYRIMAVRFHPDNPETGDVEKFLQLRAAYQVLSDPERRAEYDSACKSREPEPDPIFGLKDFVVGVEAETNRRLGVLSLLYNQRRRDPDHPGVSLLDLERQMAFPREHLQFTMWYLRAKKYVELDDSSEYTLTAVGVDFVESNAPTNSLLDTLLHGRSATGAPSGRNSIREGYPLLRARWPMLEAAHPPGAKPHTS